jgi:hypothetical protein
MLVEYPKTNKGTWLVIADKDGTLTDTATKKKYSYLFWEALKTKPYTLDEKNAYCVSSKESEKFLEDSLTTLGLNLKEKNDFIVYWLPILEQNKYSLVEFKTTEYTDTAKLDVIPKPASMIRVFMVFKKSDKKVKTGSPKMKKVTRK